MKFTDRQIKNLKPGPERYEVFEDNGKGLGMRVSPTGRKTWIHLYRFNGKARRKSLGTYPEMTVAQAHEVHAKDRADLQRGIDPGAIAVQVRHEERKAPTVAGLAEEYIEKWAKPRKRSWQEDKRILDKDVLPAWGSQKVRSISRRDVITLLDGIVDRGAPIAANRTLACIRKMFNFAVNRDIVEVSPCAQIHAPSAENRRDRTLSADEIRALWLGLDRAHMAEGTKLALKLQLLTAQRNGEVVNAAWNEIDLASGWWTIPAAKAKNKLIHRVPLSPQVQEILEQARILAADSPWVFPSPRGDKPMTETAMGHAVRKNLEVLDINQFTPHDLRRTAASHMTGMGVSRLVVSKILNHVESGITAVYDRHSYDAEKRHALEAWGQRLESIIAGADGKAAPLTKAG